MTSTMAQTSQPGFLAAWVNAFTAFDEAHGFAVNLFVVVALAVTGAAFLSGRPRLIRPVLIGFTVLCLADWVLIEDLGFLGGLGTDPNSMIPMVLLATAGYLAVARAPAEAPAPASSPAAAASWRDRLRTAIAPQAVASAGIRSVAAVGAIGVIILGAAPMAVAQASPVADTILAQAIDGTSTPLDSPAPAFSLTDQHGRDITLASLRGKVVLLTFLDGRAPPTARWRPRSSARPGSCSARTTAASSWWPSWPTRSTTSSATPRPSTGKKAWTACRTGCT